MTSSHDSENRRHLGTKQGGRSLDTPHPVIIPIVEVLSRLPPTREREFQTIVVPGIPGTSASKLYICLGDSSNPPVYSWVDFIATASGAPSTVDYLVGTANATLTSEIVVGTTPGGELGGTWPTPTVDTTHSGSSHAGTQAAAEATAAAALAGHTGDTGDAHDASAISIVDAGGDFTATDVEGALDELQADHEADAAALIAPHHTVRFAAGVPAGAPAGTEIPVAFDSTAVTGGVYYWTGAAWVKGGTI